MDSNYCCTECESESLAWEETSIGRSDPAGIANGRVQTRNKARELRDQLKQHFARSNQAIWIAVQNRGEQDPDQYWIGRALRIVKEYTTGGSVEGVDRRERYDVGERFRLIVDAGHVVGGLLAQPFQVVIAESSNVLPERL